LTFFPNQGPRPAPEQKEQQQDRQEQQQKVDPRMVIIDGSNLIKVVEDNPEIPEGKVDRGLGMAGPYGMWQPSNYNPETGEQV
jgi:hypothetical protein